MNRPTREHVLMETAYLWAKRSTCSRLHVGCVIHRDGRILVQGYNGAPAGLKHCDHECTCWGNYLYFDNAKQAEVHRAGCTAALPCTRAVHAEQNAISFAARWGVGLEGAELYCTHQPCLPCAQTVINAGISKVWFSEPYRLQDGLDLLIEVGIKVERIVDFIPPN